MVWETRSQPCKVLDIGGESTYFVSVIFHLNTPDAVSDPGNNLSLVRDAYDAFKRGDIDTALGLMDENIEWHEAEGFLYGGTYHGPDEVLKGVFMKLATEWEGWETVPEEFIDGGDTIVVLGQYSGTYKKSGKSMQAPYVHVFKVRDGKVSEFRQYTDTVLVQRALGEDA